MEHLTFCSFAPFRTLGTHKTKRNPPNGTLDAHFGEHLHEMEHTRKSSCVPFRVIVHFGERLISNIGASNCRLRVQPKAVLSVALPDGKKRIGSKPRH